MIKCEKELEDYICENQKDFINCLKKIYGEDEDIKFVGRQVRLGNDNIVDLLYYSKDCEQIPTGLEINHYNFYIVELKYRQLVSSDISQLCRYMNILRKKINDIDGEIYIGGIFVSDGIDDNVSTIAFQLDDIVFLDMKQTLNFERLSYSYKEEYINSLKLDERINKIIMENE